MYANGKIRMVLGNGQGAISITRKDLKGVLWCEMEHLWVCEPPFLEVLIAPRRCGVDRGWDVWSRALRFLILCTVVLVRL